MSGTSSNKIISELMSEIGYTNHFTSQYTYIVTLLTQKIIGEVSDYDESNIELMVNLGQLRKFTRSLKDYSMLYIGSEKFFLAYNDGEKVFFYARVDDTDGLESARIRIRGFHIKVIEMKSMMMQFFEAPEPYRFVRWAYNGPKGSLDYEGIKIKEKKLVNELYPFLNKPLSEYYQDFWNSNSNILLLIGPPGTGKTTFINGLIHSKDVYTAIAYDPAVISSDALYTSFFHKVVGTGLLVLEDADIFIMDRDKNDSGAKNILHKFLSVGDGLISTSARKIVFSTNLQSIKDIDPALVRKGRCFDILHFRALTCSEANVASEKMNLNISTEEGKTYTLAEIFNESESERKVDKKLFGFIA